MIAPRVSIAAVATITVFNVAVLVTGRESGAWVVAIAFVGAACLGSMIGAYLFDRHQRGRELEMVRRRAALFDKIRNCPHDDRRHNQAATLALASGHKAEVCNACGTGLITRRAG